MKTTPFKINDEVWFIRETRNGYAIENGLLYSYVEEVYYSGDYKNGSRKPKLCYIYYPYLPYPGWMPNKITVDASRVYPTKESLLESLDRNRMIT